MTTQDAFKVAKAVIAATMVGLGLYKTVRASKDPVPIASLPMGARFYRLDPNKQPIKGTVFIRATNTLDGGQVSVAQMPINPQGIPQSVSHLRLDAWLLVMPAD